MANKPNLEREEIIERIEGLLIMGFWRPTEILKQERRIADFETAKRYIDIAQRRLRNRYSQINKEKILKRELRDLDFMEKRLWLNYDHAINYNEKTGAINAILRCKERRAKLLGLDIETLKIGPIKTLEDLIQEAEYEKIQQPTTNRELIVDSKQAGAEGEVPAQSSPTEAGKGNDGQGFHPKSEAEGS